MTVPSFAEAFRVFGRIGLMSFGGPAGQIALMHRTLVEETKWLTERQYLNALSFCMLLPGPEAMQLATWSGWRLHGVRGGLMAGLLFVLPGAALVLLLAALYAAYGQVPLMQALFIGIKAAVLAIVLQALARIAGKALKRRDHWILAGVAFVGIFFFGVPFPLIVLGAGLYGLLSAAAVAEPQIGAALPPVSWGGAARTASVWLVIWLVPLALLWAALGAGHVLVELGLLFSKLAVVTFGGAYAVLSWLAEEVSVLRDWLTPAQMVDGLGLAETTPGPLILVTEFVAFLAAKGEGGWAMGLAGAAVCLWATFAPCFLWVFVGAPFIERLDQMPKLRSALAAITAAVVGVILNLALWFGLHVLFGEVRLEALGPVRLWVPDPSSLDWRTAGLAALSAALVFGARIGVLPLLGVMAALGAALG